MDNGITPSDGKAQLLEGTPGGAWNRSNLLSLDGGGVRSYWTLLMISKLMEYIAIAEEGIETQEHQTPVCSSFSPLDYPENSSLGPFSEEEDNKLGGAKGTIEKCRAREKTRRYLPCHYFDFICGSSTGALVAIMLGRLRMPIKDCIDEYKHLARKTLGNSRQFTELNYPFIPGHRRTKYNAKKFRMDFEDIVDRRNQWSTDETRNATFPAEQDLCKTFVTSLMRLSDKHEYEKLHLLRSYSHNPRRVSDSLKGPSRKRKIHANGLPTGKSSKTSYGGFEVQPSRRNINYGSAQNFEIWQIARAATAAPWYFDELKIPTKPRSIKHMVFTDASFSYTNNPTGQGVSEIKEANGKNSVGIVVSIGAARLDRSPEKSFRSRLRSKISRATDPKFVHERMLGACDEDGSGFTYYRLDDPGGLDVKIDEWKPTDYLHREKSGSATLHRIEVSFTEWLGHYLNVDALKDCAAELVAQRRTRTNDRDLWERYATGAKFTCDHEGCNQKAFNHRGVFKDHLIKNYTGSHKFDLANIENEIERCKTEWKYNDIDKS